MNKKILSLILSTFMVMTLLSGCGSNSEVLEEVTTDNMATQNTAANNGETETINNATTESGVTTKNNETQTTVAKKEISDMIGKDEAKKIALKKVPGATDSDIRIHFDRDDGRDIYEGSIVYNEMEYDFEIDAMTGDIIEWETESIYD